jgi:Flp pilus assembly pilin Flp
VRRRNAGGFRAHNHDGLSLEALSSEAVFMLAFFPFFRSERGQGLAEYALILSLIAIVAVAALLFLGGVIQSILSKIGASL